MANVDSNLQCGRGAKSNLGHRDEVINNRLVIFIFAMSSAFVMCVGIVILVMHTEVSDAKMNRPNLFIRLLDKGGLDHVASPPTSPFFQLVFDVDGVPPGYQVCSGGGNSLLHVSYHGMILAWGQMPYFCINGCKRTDVATLKAKAEASVLREEVRNLIWNEIQVVGRIEFDVEGEVAGLGYLHCKFFISEDETADIPKSLCLIHY
ncbi:hypothetical protein HU200_042740 [Digitaria exilis]|uniref:Uncharacterized protein n=1 Tax=Digitaria exilis TaxID=1010633 RepID=A0A835B5U0_9POAL|nr:hypothetical protein HU200_042740 [Digitaria exilis]